MKKLFLLSALCFLFRAADAQCTAYFYAMATDSTVYFFENAFANDSITNVVWTFGDGDTSFLTNPVHTYPIAGTYDVCLTIVTVSNCTNTWCDSVVIPGNNSVGGCQAAFTESMQGLDVQFTNTSTGGGFFNINYALWNFGDGSYSNDLNAQHTYAQGGTFEVCLQFISYDPVNDDTCISSACNWVIVFDSTGNNMGGCNACFNYNANFLDVDFSNCSSYDSSSTAAFYWSFGDGSYSTDIEPSHSYIMQGDYEVCLQLVALNFLTNDSCGNLFCEWIHVDSSMGGSCNADFYVSAIDTVTNTIWLTEQSTGASGYEWDFGDGNTSTDQYPTHVYAQAGFYDVCLTITCNNQTSQYCLLVGLIDSLTSGGNVRTGLTLNVVAPEGINEIPKAATLNVFPNPGNDQVNFVVPADINGVATLQLRNVMGQVVQNSSLKAHEGNTEAIDVHALPAGMYMLQLQYSGQLYYANFMKE